MEMGRAIISMETETSVDLNLGLCTVNTVPKFKVVRSPESDCDSERVKNAEANAENQRRSGRLVDWGSPPHKPVSIQAEWSRLQDSDICLANVTDR